MLVLAHLSDTHVDAGEYSAERVARVMGYLDEVPGPLDAILVTGDIADHGRPDEYARARTLLKSSRPVLTCPGNHDERSAYRECLLGEPAPASDQGPVNSSHRVGGALFAMCDTSIPGRVEGSLGDDTVTWLDRELTASGVDTPAFVCFHHPPVLLHSPFLDGIRQYGEERLAAVLERHPQVVAVLCGHAHTAAATTFAGRPLLVAPAVSSTLLLPWEGADRLDYRQPPGVAFHVLDDEWRLTTHYRLLP
jgi:Icc protein